MKRKDLYCKSCKNLWDTTSTVTPIYCPVCGSYNIVLDVEVKY